MNTGKPAITIKSALEQPVYSAALAVFRILFGLMICGSVVRIWAKGWIEELYIKPTFFFHYYGFEWVKPIGGYTYILFIICGISALWFALGLFYRISSVVLFLSFTYIELMDKTNYLNHYYFVSLILFLMMWLPAHVNLSADSLRIPGLAKRMVPRWTVGSIRLMLGIVYVYAGLAKLNTDWLVNAMPLRLWLPAKNDMPLIGSLFNKVWVAYLFSWFGAFYDLTIPFFLLNRHTRLYAYATVIVFHVLTALLFPIGMFPYVMILATLIFFDTAEIDNMVTRIKGISSFMPATNNNRKLNFAPAYTKGILTMFALFFALQAILPWRYLIMPGELFWTEEGYRFSWRVMLMEKTGYAQFVVRDTVTGAQIGVNNNDFLTKNQEKMMATQPDFILQYAQMLHDVYARRGMNDPEVYANVYVSLNGRRSRPYVDPNVNLVKQKDTYSHKKWIMAFNDKIHGL